VSFVGGWVGVAAIGTMPGPPPTFVARPRLRDALDDAATLLTVVAAGPGTGKTALLADWARDRDDLAVWWSLTAADDAGARFWPAFVQAAVPRDDLSVPVAWSPGGAGELLAAAFAADPPGRPRVVVLDEAHLLTSPDIIEGLDLVVRRWPDRVRLVLAARHDPLLPLHRYRLAGQLREIRSDDLAMTRTEAAALLGAHRTVLPAAELDELLARTAGWVGGLVMAAAALAGGADPHILLDGLTRVGGGIAEYLVTEVLGRQPRRVRGLLLATSLLGEVDAALAEAVVDLPGAADLLAGLARAGPFVTAVDPAYTRFRYAPLFRDVLASVARSESPQDADEVFARASAWLAANGDPLGALRWAAQESTPEHAHRLLVHGGLARAAADGVDLGHEVGRLLLRRPTAPDGTATRAEQLVLAWALAAIGPGEPAAAASRLAEIAAHRNEVDPAEPALALTAYVAEVLLAQRCADGPVLDRAARRLSSDTVLGRLVRTVPGLAARIRLLHARSRFTTGHPEDVEPLLLDALEHAEHEDDPPAARLAILAALALAMASATRPSRAAAAVTQAEALLAANPNLTPPVALDLGIARDAYVRADLPRMRAAVDRMVAAGPVYPDHSIAASVAFLQATLLAATGELTGAEKLLRGPTLHDPRAGLLTVYASCELAAVVTARGQPREALRILAGLAGKPYEICGAVAAARAHLEIGDLDGARNHVRQVRTVPSPLVTRLTLVEALVCEALIALRTDAYAIALDALQQALDLAGGEVVVPFARAADDLAPLLERFPVLATRWPAALPAGADDGGAPAARPAALTPREIDVLRLLATGSSAVAISDELAVSVTTVKTHLAAAYRKLGVRGRRDAVRRARELGMS
jgi:LuxR family transcriptional regulator, maltose regulon positive regulatory protein